MKKSESKVRPVTYYAGTVAAIKVLFYDFLKLRVASRWVVNATIQPEVPVVENSGWELGPVWTGTESPAPTGVRTLNLAARGEALYLLSNPGRAR